MSVGGPKKAKTVTQVWYSLRISEHTYSFLKNALQRLTQGTSLEDLTGGVMAADEGHFASMKNVWLKWLDLSAKSEPWVVAGRNDTFKQDPQVSEGLSIFLSEIPSEHKASAKRWFKDALLLPKAHSREELKHENVTLTGSGSGRATPFSYCIPSDCLPFVGWDYKEAKAFRTIRSLQEMYSEYVSHVLAQCANRLVSGQVKVHYILSDCMEMQAYLPDGLKFDRITTSNLCDYIPLPTLLKMCKPLLNQVNPHSVVITESLNWWKCFPEIGQKMTMDLMLNVHKERVTKDTGNPAIAASGTRTGFADYYVFASEFEHFLRASLLSGKPNNSSRARQIPSLKAIALKHGFVLRDFCRNRNRIYPFRWAVNCRRVTQLTGFERAVEWILPGEQ